MTLGLTKRTIIRISKVVESGARNCVFIKTTLEEPHKLIIELIDRYLGWTIIGNSYNIKYKPWNNMINKLIDYQQTSFIKCEYCCSKSFSANCLFWMQIVVPNHLLLNSQILANHYFAHCRSEKVFLPHFVEQSLPGQSGTLFTTRC